MPTREELLEAVGSVEDPELGMSIVELGLVYRAEIVGDRAEIDVTFTYPGCPAEPHIRREIAQVLAERFGTVKASVKTVWSPPWGPERMSEAARLSLGYPI